MRFAALALVAAALGGCAGGSAGYDSDDLFTKLPRETGRNLATDTGQKAQQCVPYAREHSGVRIYGDAWTWWDKAAGKFPRGPLPQQGAVMVLTNYAGPDHGHVAVVRKIISAREIRVDHANWLNDGSIFLNNPVVDVSAANDWSLVRVWNIQTGAWGGKTYPVQGFIGGSDRVPELAPHDTDRLALADNSE